MLRFHLQFLSLIKNFTLHFNMKRYLRIALLFFLLAVISPNAIQARNITEEKEGYIFGYATCLGDSVVYLSEIQPIQGVIINRKTGLAEMQSQYSHEFEQALKHKYNKHFTCAVYVSNNKHALEKKFIAITRNLSKNKSVKVGHVGQSEFQFKPTTNTKQQ